MNTVIEPGTKVHYTSPYLKKENGIVKSINETRSEAFVVYHCAGEWDNYMNYTGALTPLEDLTPGWIDEK